MVSLLTQTESSRSARGAIRLRDDALTTLRRLDPSRRTYPLLALSMNLFPGSVNERIGALSKFASDDNAEYALWDAENRQFVVARPLGGSEESKHKVLVVLTVTPAHQGVSPVCASTTCLRRPELRTGGNPEALENRTS